MQFKSGFGLGGCRSSHSHSGTWSLTNPLPTGTAPAVSCPMEREHGRPPANSHGQTEVLKLTSPEHQPHEQVWEQTLLLCMEQLCPCKFTG